MLTPEQIASFTKHFKLKPGLKLLDAGCGFGYSMQIFWSILYSRCITGRSWFRKNASGDSECIVEARKVGKTSKFCAGDIYDLPFDDSTFDVVISQILLCHLSKPEKGFDELVRVIKKRGYVAIFDVAETSDWVNFWNNSIKSTMEMEKLYLEMMIRYFRYKSIVLDLNPI